MTSDLYGNEGPVMPESTKYTPETPRALADRVISALARGDPGSVAEVLYILRLDAVAAAFAEWAERVALRSAEPPGEEGT